MIDTYKDHGHPPGCENEHDPRCQACAQSELASSAGSAFLVQKLGRLLQMPEREWTEKDILEACRDLLARHKHMCSQFQEAAQKYRLGLGGEPVDRLVLDELHRLKQNDTASGDGEHSAMNTEQTNFEPLPARAGSVTAVQIVADLLSNPYPHDLMAIRREVEREWVSEEVAREEMDAYCTHEAMMEARRKWNAAQDAARDWLSSQND